MKRLLTSVVLGLCVLAVNPMVACQSDGENGSEFEFGEVDMRQAVVGTYTGMVLSNREDIRITIEQRGAPSARSAQHYKRVQCSTRSFVKPAAACLDITTMEVTAHVSSELPELAEAEFTGTFQVYGWELDHGELILQGQGSTGMSASFNSSDGGLIHWSYQGADRVVELELTKEKTQE